MILDTEQKVSVSLLKFDKFLTILRDSSQCATVAMHLAEKWLSSVHYIQTLCAPFVEATKPKTRASSSDPFYGFVIFKLSNVFGLFLSSPWPAGNPFDCSRNPTISR
jgi:hypothetical protein